MATPRAGWQSQAWGCARISLSLSPSPGVQHLAEGEPRTAWWQSDLQMAITLWFLSSLLWKNDDL